MKSKLVSTDVIQPELPRLAELKKRVCVADPMAAAVSTGSIASSLLRSKFEDCQRLFYVYCGASKQSETLAAVVARVSPTVNDEDGKPVGMLGFFDSVDDQAAASDVLNAARTWLKDQGCISIVGPIDGDTWHKYRFNVGPDTDSPFLLEPTNPTYYRELFVSAGFEVVDRYHSLRVENIEGVLPTLKPAYEFATNAGFRFRPLRPNQFDDELGIIYEIGTSAFRENFLYDDISWDEFRGLYSDARALIRPELVRFVEDESGRAVGFLFCLIDYYRAVVSMKGGSGLWAKLKFIWNRSAANAVNFKSIAVLPEHRRAKLGGALMYQAYQESLKLGFNKANLCLIRDGNPSSRLDGGNSRVLRRYELYQTPGSQLRRDN